MRTLVPGLSRRHGEARQRRMWRTNIPTSSAAPARVLAGRAAGLDLFVLDAPHLFDRPGNPYLGPDGRDWPDNAIRFAALARVGADIGFGVIPGLRARSRACPRLAGGARLGLSAFRRPAEAGNDDHDPQPGVPGPLSDGSVSRPRPSGQRDDDRRRRIFRRRRLPEGRDPAIADAITTVSPTYAAEIMTPEFGMALDGLLQLSRLRSAWHPQRDRRGRLESCDRPGPRPALQR